MRMRRYLTHPLLLLVGAVLSPAASALELDIQGVHMTTIGPGDQCVLIAGEYPGLRIEPSEAGLRAKICYDVIRQNLIVITDVTFVSTQAGGTDVSINFSHTFSPGPNRRVVAHTRMSGFFATNTGVGVATGAIIKVTGTFGQNGNADPIGDGVSHTVGDDIDSGIFADEQLERYLAAGVRTLTGTLAFTLPEQGDKLVLPVGVQVDVQPVTRIQEKFEEAEEGVESEFGIDEPPI